MDFRGNMEFGRSEDYPKEDTHSKPTRNLSGDEDFSGSTSGGQNTKGEYSGGGYLGSGSG